MRVGAGRVFLRVSHAITVRVGVGVSAARIKTMGRFPLVGHSIGISVREHGDNSVRADSTGTGQIGDDQSIVKAIRECGWLKIRERKKTGRAIYFNVGERTRG